MWRNSLLVDYLLGIICLAGVLPQLSHKVKSLSCREIDIESNAVGTEYRETSVAALELPQLLVRSTDCLPSHALQTKHIGLTA
jgi:hypothetical protein